jgi:hypothetical protein
VLNQPAGKPQAAPVGRHVEPIGLHSVLCLQIDQAHDLIRAEVPHKQIHALDDLGRRALAEDGCQLFFVTHVYAPLVCVRKMCVRKMCVRKMAAS